MAFDTALTAGQLQSLRGTSSLPPSHRPRVYISLCANTTVYSGRLNIPDGPTYPAVELAVDGGSGTAANIQPNMTILFARTDDRAAAYARGRVRGTPSLSGGAGTIYIGEAYEDFQDNDYYWIINDFALHAILPADVAGKPVPDVDTAFRPLRPIIYNLKSVYAGLVDISTTKLRIAFAPLVAAAANGATISSYAWTVPSGGAIVVGSGTTQNVTIDFDEGFKDWVTVAATDSNGEVRAFRFHVWAHGSTHPATLLEWDEFEGEQSISNDPNDGSADGYGGSVAAFDGVDTVLDHTLVCVWVEQTYNGTDTDIGSAGNILLTGRLRSEDNPLSIDDETGQRDISTHFQIEGPLQQLAGLPAFEMEILADVDPDEFNEVEALTVWRALWLLWDEYSTASGLHSLKFFEVGTTYLYPGFRTQGRDVLTTLADIAQSINAVFQDNAAGMFEVARRGTMMSTSDRSALATIATWGKSDYHGRPEWSRDHLRPVGRMLGDGGYYNSDLDTTTGFEVRAGGASGPEEARLNRQILVADQSEDDARAELQQRAGHALAAQQPPETVTLEMPSGYHGLTPDVGVWHSLSIAADESPRGRVFSGTTRWQLLKKAVGISVDTQEIACRCTFFRETSGVAGQIVDYPPVDEGEYPISPGDLIDIVLPPPSEDDDTDIDLSTGDPTSGTYDGNWDSACTNGQNYIEVAFSLGGRKTIKQVRITTTATAAVTGTKNTLWLRRTAEFPHAVGQWNTAAGSQVTVFNLNGIVADSLIVRIYGDDDDCVDTIVLDSITYTALEQTWHHSIDFRVTQGGFSAFNGDRAQWAGGSGWGVGVVGADYLIQIIITIPTTHISRIEFVYSAVPGDGVQIGLPNDDADDFHADGSSAGALSFAAEPNVSSTGIWLSWSNGVGSPTTAYITRMTISGRGSNPFA